MGNRPHELLSALQRDTQLPDSRIGEAQDHFPCLACGYDLMGMPKGAQCPECGAPVALSMRGDLLSHSLPAWSRMVGWHLRLAGILLIILPFAAVVLAFIHQALPALALALIIAGWCYAAIQSTRREHLSQEPGRLRSAVRTSAIALAIIVVGWLWALAAGAPLNAPFMFCAVSVPLLVSVAILMRWVADLMLRVPSTDLYNALDWRTWPLVAMGALLILAALSPTCLFLIFGPLWIVCMLMAGYALIQAGDQVLLESRLARRNWIEHEALLHKEDRFRPPPSAS